MTEKCIAELKHRLTRRFPDLAMEENAPMSRYTTLRLGGPADLLLEPSSPEEVQGALIFAKECGVPVTLIGRGSNLLVLDGGIRGLTLRIAGRLRGIRQNATELTVLAGTSMSALSVYAAEHDLAGLTFAGGIPGTVGGGAVMNAGAYGGEMKQVVTGASGFDMDGSPVRFTADQLQMSYRRTALQDGQAVVCEVMLHLTQGDGSVLRAEMEEFNRRRAEKQPLLKPSAGSTFKRPEVGYAAALIEECGLKGMRIGGASVSEKHAGFLINEGGTAADFMALIARVQQTVLEQKGVQLTPEVRILGDAGCIDPI